MATNERKKQTKHSERKHDRSKQRDLRNGNLRGALDLRAKKGPERSPGTGIAANGPETGGKKSRGPEWREAEQLGGNESVPELAEERHDLVGEELEGFARLRILDLLPWKTAQGLNSTGFTNALPARKHGLHG